MKKVYISPQLITKKVESEQHLMTVSTEGNSVYGFSEETGEVSNAAVKGADNKSIWDDDWN